MVTRSRKKVQKNLVKNKNIQLAIVAVVLILVILGLAIFSGNAGHSYALYLKDKEIFYTSAGKLKPWQTTEQFIDTEEIDEKTTIIKEQVPKAGISIYKDTNIHVII